MQLRFVQGQELPSFTVLTLPIDMREELRRPLGPIVAEEQLAGAIGGMGPICTVGDMCTETVRRLGGRIRVAVVDYQTKRVPDETWREATADIGDVVVFVRNEAGVITSELYNALRQAWGFRGSTKIVVEGEEDLASLPAILHAPGGATVIYGIPDTGLALVQVDEGVRKQVADALGEFEPGSERPSPTEGD